MSGEGKGISMKQGTRVEQRRGCCGEVKLGTWQRRGMVHNDLAENRLVAGVGETRRQRLAAMCS